MQKNSSFVTKCAHLALYVLGFALLFGFYQNLQTYRNLKKSNLAEAASYAKKARFLPQILSVLNLGIIKDFKVWSEGLEIIINAEKLSSEFNHYAQTFFDPNVENIIQARNIRLSLDKINDSLKEIKKANQKSIVAKLYLDPKLISKVAEICNDLNTLVNYFLVNEHRYILIFQNSQEIRATGGFMGSFARVTLNNGQLAKLKIEDIYEPDGQFTGFVKAPPGVSDYLSGGQGMRLPDSNWHPDFPTSAQQVLNYFAYGKEQNIQGLIAVNLDVLQNLLKITGPIDLPDQNITITEKNFAELARADRAEFFPGSQSKTIFLDHAFNQIKFKLSQLNQEQQNQLIKQLVQDLNTKNIQFYSNQEVIQNIFEKNDLAGELKKGPSLNSILNQLQNFTDQSNPKTNSGINFLSAVVFPPPQVHLLLLESNVGVNKANKAIDRNVVIKLTDRNMAIDINFANNNQPYISNLTDWNPYVKQANHMGYVNYQRVITNPDVKVKKIALNNQAIKHYDEQIIMNSQGSEFKQIGFLISVAEQKQGNVSIELELANNFGDNPKIFIQKQAGLPETSYTIKYGDNQGEAMLMQDMTVSFR